jgi:hypothetical protein
MTPAAAEPDRAAEAVSAFADQAAMARRLRDEGVLWGALLFGRNAAALAALLGRDGARESVDLVRMAHDSRARLLRGDQVCPVCEGSGARKTQSTSLKGELIEQTVVGARCELCGGRGRIPARTPDTVLAREEAEALRNYAAEQRQRGMAEARGIWLPAGLYETLTVRDRAALRKAFGVSCSSCRGFGSTSCTACNGAQVLKCPNAACVSGVEICQDCDGRGRSSTTRGSTSVQDRCQSCRGTGRRICLECGGKGVVVCDKCQGQGEIPCRTCNGTGDAPACAKCKGDGTIECTRCAGTGKIRGEPCATCAGEGLTLCKACDGSGRVARR